MRVSFLYSAGTILLYPVKSYGRIRIGLHNQIDAADKTLNIILSQRVSFVKPSDLEKMTRKGAVP